MNKKDERGKSFRIDYRKLTEILAFSIVIAIVGFTGVTVIACYICELIGIEINISPELNRS